MSSKKEWTLSDDIRALRKSLGWSQQEFAVELGRTLPAVSRWENGNFKPHREILLKMARLSDDEQVVEVFLRAAHLPKHEWGPYYPGQRLNVSRPQGPDRGWRQGKGFLRIAESARANAEEKLKKNQRAQRAWHSLLNAADTLLDCAQDGISFAEQQLVRLSDEAEEAMAKALKQREGTNKEENP